MKRLVTEVENEGSLHAILKEYGFVTNYKKSKNAIGTDVVALKNGEEFRIEHKKARINKNTGAYKIDGNVSNADIMIVTTPKNRSFFVLSEKTSITKTCRFIDSV